MTITMGQSNSNCATVADKPVKKKRLGAMYDPNFVMGDAFGEPWPEEELKLWNCEGEGDLLGAELSSVQQPK